MEQIGTSTWWASFWPRLPVVLVLLAGVVLALVAYLNRRRRTASCLGAIGFATLLILNLLGSLTPLWVARMARQGHVVRAGLVNGVVGLLLSLANAVGIVLLIGAVIVEERRGRAHPEEAA